MDREKLDIKEMNSVSGGAQVLVVHIPFTSNKAAKCKGQCRKTEKGTGFITHSGMNVGLCTAYNKPNWCNRRTRTVDLEQGTPSNFK